MRRRTFDLLVSWVGVLLAMVFLVAGVMLTAGYRYANQSVGDQLTAQNIFFPPAGSEALASPEVGPFLNQYAGQQLVNGAQAEAYANHFIAVHLKEVAGGKTYAEVSALAREDPENQDLQGQVNTLFKGETLRSMLLTASAFWKLGQIALWAAIAAFIAAAIMGIMTILGFIHMRTVPPDVELGAANTEKSRSTVNA